MCDKAILKTRNMRKLDSYLAAGVVEAEPLVAGVLGVSHVVAPP